MSDVFNRVKEIVNSYLEIDADKIKPESKIADDLGADSLTTMDIVIGLETEFNIEEIPDEAIQKIVTIQDIVDFVEEHQS